MKLVIRKCPKCKGGLSEKEENGDITCLYCGKVEYTILKEATKVTGVMGNTSIGFDPPSFAL